VTAALSTVASHLDGAERRGEDVQVVDATHDSRRAAPDWLFCAIVGACTDGHDHAADAVDRGAAALLVERWLDLPVPQVRVPSVRAATGPAAACVHGRPSDELTVVGLTGTNGKTTTAYLLEGAFAASGVGVGVIGTVETRIHGTPEPGVRTTPEGTDLQRLLRTMHTRGVDAVAMEVSSHGLDLHRVDGTRFAVAVYTNLSQDHLDWHGTMDAYLAAKARLFTRALSERGVVYLDGPWAARLLELAEIPVVTLGRDAGDMRIVDEQHDVEGGSATLRFPDRALSVRTRMPGTFNLTNAATAVVAAIVAGGDDDAAVDGVAACPGAPGRFERVDAGQPFTVLVDYAHTPDAVEHVIATVRGLLPADGRITIVLGCGGDRDRDKRGPMGAAATAADVAVLTSDNPRSEDPDAIIAAMLAGARAAVDAGGRAEVVVEPDRRAAGARDVPAAAGQRTRRVPIAADPCRPFAATTVAVRPPRQRRSTPCPAARSIAHRPRCVNTASRLPSWSPVHNPQESR
jgi:UDP-N-acetylmuramoyl-L-alanyl-D-glutamate--2,6-diaminopimelate ligase